MTLTHAHTHTYTHTHTHSLSHIHWIHTHSLSLSHTHIRTHSLTHTYTHIQTHSLSLSHIHAHVTHPLSLSHTHTHTNTFSLSLSLSLSHTRTHIYSFRLALQPPPVNGSRYVLNQDPTLMWWIINQQYRRTGHFSRTFQCRTCGVGDECYYHGSGRAPDLERQSLSKLRDYRRLDVCLETVCNHITGLIIHTFKCVSRPCVTA